MIQGHIDFVSRSRVEGWVSSPQWPLRGARVLAFVDETCVGGGIVELFRQDLADAGVGDGFVGFRIPVALEPWHDTRLLDIRLEGSAFLLKQRRSCLALRDAQGADRRRQGREPESLSWMLSRGWIDQTQYDALRLLGLIGAHTQLLPPALSHLEPRRRCDEVAIVAAGVLEVHLLQPMALEIREDLGADSFAAMRDELREAFPAVPPVVGLWSERRGTVAVEEGAQHAGAPAASNPIEHGFGDRELLLLNLDTAPSLPRGGGAERFTAFVPCRPEV
ncbi:hypothetical protein [Aureimonas sp. AU20]|uniref:hypothetical protein n=1 Tax=Aureimonas sp. AU20 TaxID=1349819 RepID=UPI0007213C63|nr:hypothetical protein [Aureimonas sp. AU20]ALN74897.1 hypothetical protein M673_19410 [Aureimonas sp. AU20]